MKRILLLLVLFIAGLQLGRTQSQTKPFIVKVKGACSYTPKVIGKTIGLKLQVDENKCDPNTGYLSLEDRLYHFEEALRTKNIDFASFERSWNSKRRGSMITEIYSYSGSEQQVFDIADIAHGQGFQVTGISELYAEKTLEEQDQHAICALEKATEKAKLIAKDMGYENCELISVDDYTSTGNMSLDYLMATMSMSDILSGGSSYSIFGYYKLY